MLIKQKRVRKIPKSVSDLNLETELRIGKKIEPSDKSLMQRIGFHGDYSAGETVLPASVFGQISEYNAHGRYDKRKDLPMETAYRSIEWHWEQFDGPYNTIPQSKIVDVPYQRYPRTFRRPPSVELTIQKNEQGEVFLVGPSYSLVPQNHDLLMHNINLFLEIFGECSILTEGIKQLIEAPARKINWTVLPKGQRAWSQLKGELEPVIKEVSEGNRPVINHRFALINQFKPEFVAIGNGGFSGYVVFGFPSKNLYVCESIYRGNATYVFREDWEILSQKTKAEVLQNNLHEDRIIHFAQWESAIENLLSN